MDLSKAANVENDIVEHHEVLSNTDEVIEQSNGMLLLDIGYQKGDSRRTDLKTTNDGHTVLIPQPSDDPNDPLNFSERKKNLLLLAISVAAFQADFQAAIGVSAVISQSAEWQMTPNQVNYATNLAVLMIGIGGIFWIPFITCWGRAPVLFWTSFIGTLFTLATALTPNFAGYYGLRALMCFFLAAGQTCGLAFIQDVYFFHQHAKKIGIWTAVFLTCPYVGPMFGYFVVAGTNEWRNVFWMTLGLEVLTVALTLLFVDETWYRRDIPRELQPERGSRMARLLGIWQIRNHSYFLTVWNSIKRCLIVAVKPVVLLVFVFVIMSFMWAVGINATSSVLLGLPEEAGGYGFGPWALGYIYFAPIIGILIGEIIGHWGNDWILSRYVRRHTGLFKPETRLWAIYPSMLLMVPGIILVGVVLQKHLSWPALACGWAMYIVGIMISAVGITTYLLDCYGTASGEISALINLARILGGFAVGYFQLGWGLKAGFDVSFGVQGAIIGASTLIIVVLQIWGPTLRRKGGALKI